MVNYVPIRGLLSERSRDPWFVFEGISPSPREVKFYKWPCIFNRLRCSFDKLLKFLNVAICNVTYKFASVLLLPVCAPFDLRRRVIQHPATEGVRSAVPNAGETFICLAGDNVRYAQQIEEELGK